jgi:hypothetical protein
MRIRPAFSVIMGAVLVAVTSACTAPGGGTPLVSASASGPRQELPAGWRWESYGGVEVGVPGDWGWDNGTQRLHQWCIVKEAHKVKPVVGRPGHSTLVGCPDGDTVLANTGTVVAFTRTKEADGSAQRGDRTTVRLDGVEVVVQAAAELRPRIAETIRRVKIDSNGCAATHAISAAPQWRPGTPANVAALPDVAGASVCKYQLGDTFAGAQPRLISSTRLDGAAAAAAIRGVAAAPVGGGPDDPASCAAEWAYGHEALVVRIRSALGPADLVIRYSGCDHNGFDDGLAVRSLTAGALAPFIAGPHEVGVPVRNR